MEFDKIVRQSQIRERIRRLLCKALPEYGFDKYPVLYLPPHLREGDRPAWSIAATRKSDNLVVDVYSQDSMSDCLLFGIKAYPEPWDRSVMIMADREAGRAALATQGD